MSPGEPRVLTTLARLPDGPELPGGLQDDRPGGRSAIASDYAGWTVCPTAWEIPDHRGANIGDRLHRIEKAPSRELRASCAARLGGLADAVGKNSCPKFPGRTPSLPCSEGIEVADSRPLGRERGRCAIAS